MIRSEGNWPLCDRPEGPWAEPGGAVAADCPKCLIALRMITVSHPDATVSINGNEKPPEHARADDFNRLGGVVTDYPDRRGGAMSALTYAQRRQECRCGHVRGWHAGDDRTGACEINGPQSGDGCDCTEFRGRVLPMSSGFTGTGGEA